MSSQVTFLLSTVDLHKRHIQSGYPLPTSGVTVVLINNKAAYIHAFVCTDLKLFQSFNTRSSSRGDLPV
jgi:hypothetical protein